MTKPPKPPKKRNVAARVLHDPLFKPKIMENPRAYRRHERFNKNPVDQIENADINQKSDKNALGSNESRD